MNCSLLKIIFKSSNPSYMISQIYMTNDELNSLFNVRDSVIEKKLS